MEIIVKGKLLECITTMSKEGTREYYSLNIYSGGKMYRVGVPRSKFLEFKSLEGKDVTVSGVSLWCNGNYSLYIRE